MPEDQNPRQYRKVKPFKNQRLPLVFKIRSNEKTSIPLSIKKLFNIETLKAWIYWIHAKPKEPGRMNIDVKVSELKNPTFTFTDITVKHKGKNYN